MSETCVVEKLCNDARADHYFWEAVYDKAVDVSADFDTQPSMPRRAGRQQNRANPDGELDGVWQDIKASRLQDGLQQTRKDLYPCICTIIVVLLTMPTTDVGLMWNVIYWNETHKELFANNNDVWQAVVVSPDPCIQGHELLIDLRWINATLTLTWNALRCWKLMSVVFPFVFYSQ